MKHNVIVGAGPMGLYLAYKLRKAGVKNIILFDPRSGEYVRPGHVNEENFVKLERALGKTKFSTLFGHIKEFERILFDEITDLGIPAQKKRFARFHEDAKKKGIIVQNSEGVEELIECDFVFDCTGSQRILVNTINQLITPPPFKLKPIRENVPIKQHLLAYVRMTETDMDKIQAATDINKTPGFFLTPEQHVNAINRMRTLGWKDFGLPQLYGVYFGKNKVCLYMESPDNLPIEAHEAWLKTVIDVSTNTTDISFSQLPASKKYKSKPRLTSYTVNPRELEEAAFTSKTLPTVIPMGDSQTEPHPTLAQGIADGLDRVDAFIKHIEVLEGNIAYFDTEEYKAVIKDMMGAHKRAIINKYNRRENDSYQMLLLAETNYTVALAKAKGLPQEAVLSDILKEIKARIAYHKGLTLRTSLLIDTKEEVSFTKQSLDSLSAQLALLAGLLIQAYENLPLAFAFEKENALLKLKQAAADLKECGNRFIKAQDTNKALAAYQEALKIYQHPALAALALEQITIHSNIVISYRKLNRHEEAIAQGTIALNLAPKTAEFAEIRKKLLYNVLKSIQTVVQGMSVDKELEINLAKQKAVALLDNHPNLLEASTYTELCLFFGKEEVVVVSAASIASIPNQASSNPSSFLSGTVPTKLLTPTDRKGCIIS